MSAADAQAIESAAREFATTVAAALKLPEGWHPPTVVAACARMGGTYLFRAFRLKLAAVQPGQAVLSDEANKYGPALLQYMATVLGGLGIKVASDLSTQASQASAKPMRYFLDTQRLLEPLFEPIVAKFGLTMPQAANAAAAATAVLIFQFAANFDTNVAFGVAAYAITEGSKTAPDPVEHKARSV